MGAWVGDAFFLSLSLSLSLSTSLPDEVSPPLFSLITDFVLFKFLADFLFQFPSHDSLPFVHYSLYVQVPLFFWYIFMVYDEPILKKLLFFDQI